MCLLHDLVVRGNMDRICLCSTFLQICSLIRRLSHLSASSPFPSFPLLSTMFHFVSPMFLSISVLSIFCGAQAISHEYLYHLDQLNNSAPLEPLRLNNATNGTVANQKNITSGPPSAEPLIPAAHLALLPTVHWDHDAGNIHNLAPKGSHEFYYASGGVSGGSCFNRLVITYLQEIS